MYKFLNKFKAVLIVLLAMSFIFLFTGASCDKSYDEPVVETPLSADDLQSLKYHREPTMEDNFHDNRVCVTLKSAFNYLEEISFKDFKIVEKVSPISYADLYTSQIPYSKDGAIPLGEAKYHHMFRIILEKHSKEAVLEACKLLETLDMVLCAEPDYILDFVDD